MDYLKAFFPPKEQDFKNSSYHVEENMGDSLNPSIRVLEAEDSNTQLSWLGCNFRYCWAASWISLHVYVAYPHMLTGSHL